MYEYITVTIYLLNWLNYFHRTEYGANNKYCLRNRTFLITTAMKDAEKTNRSKNVLIIVSYC
jgi:hypothetical protein